MIPYSLLDLAPVPEGGTPGQALHNSLDLAQHAETWGYKRARSIANVLSLPSFLSGRTSCWLPTSLPPKTMMKVAI